MVMWVGGGTDRVRWPRNSTHRGCRESPGTSRTEQAMGVGPTVRWPVRTTYRMPVLYNYRYGTAERWSGDGRTYRSIGQGTTVYG
jgi:hypothetical protein